MFRNPGKKLQILAIVIFFLHILLGLLAGFGLSMFLSSRMQALGRIAFVPAFLPIVVCALIGVFLGWLNSILLYAFGALVRDAAELRQDLSAIAQLVMDPQPEDAPAPAEPVSNLNT